ncbi:HEAT repeat domain-containing protein, partial [Yersinia enterocolitica]
DNSNADNSQLTQEHIYNWINYFNRSWIKPNTKQKERICQLIDEKPDVMKNNTNVLSFFCSTHQ